MMMTRRDCACECSALYTQHPVDLGAASLMVTRFANSFDAVELVDITNPNGPSTFLSDFKPMELSSHAAVV
jgi:hypothetical protein